MTEEQLRQLFQQKLAEKYPHIKFDFTIDHFDDVEMLYLDDIMEARFNGWKMAYTANEININDKIDKKIIELALKKVLENFDDFIDQCHDENGDVCTPSQKALAKARACLPQKYMYAFKNKLK